MKVTHEKNEKIANMIFASIYTLYLKKLEKKGRTKTELNKVIEWFTSYNEKQIQNHLDEQTTFKIFFEKAKIHSKANLIKGVVCGYRIEEIDEKFNTYKQSRRLDKLVDELAKGLQMEKILRI